MTMLADLEPASPIEIVRGYLKRAPVNLDEMSSALGLKVQRQFMADDVSGKIERSGDSYVITINALHSPTRQRFTQAHEIAHYVLHRDLIGDGIVDDAMYRSSQLRSELETQANRFAADLLMPVPLVRQAYRTDGIRDLASLTAKFQVSEDAMRIRLKQIGLAA